jgi:aminopeptidase
MNDFNEKLAKLAVNYSVKVKPGDIVMIRGYEVSLDLMRAIYLESLRAGGHPRLDVAVSGTQELFLKYANDDQLVFINPILKPMYESVNCIINIMDDYNRKKFARADPEKMQRRQKLPEMMELLKIYKERELKGDLRWVIVPYPCNSLAQEANMDYYSYRDFVINALYLDKEDPVAEWQRVHNEQERLIEQLNKVSEIHVVGEDTDLRMSVEGRKWLNSDGSRNLPGGEVFTSPVEDSINGHIRFTFPGIYMGKEIENIFLEVKDGKVVKATAEKGQDILDEVLKVENADLFGEFAIGTNKGIKEITKVILFDEKIGGCIHMALGRGFGEAGGQNMSAIHWDIIKNMETPESKVFADNKVIYEAGEWKI